MERQGVLGGGEGTGELWPIVLSVHRKALEMSCAIQNQLARILAEFEMTLERDVLQPLSRLSEEELPAILKHKKSLQKLVSDWNTLKSRLSQAAKNSGSSQGLGGGPSSHSHITTANKVETLKEEEEELKKKVEQCKVRSLRICE